MEIFFFRAAKLLLSHNINGQKVIKNGHFAPNRHIVTLFNNPKLLKSQENHPLKPHRQQDTRAQEKRRCVIIQLQEI